MPIDQKSSTDLNAQRRRAVQLRLAGHTLAQVRDEIGLSTPTIVAAVKAFKSGGWAAVDVKPRGRPRLNDEQASTTAMAQTALLAHLIANPGELWSSTKVRSWLEQEHQLDVSLQTTASYLQSWQLLPENQLRRTEASSSTASRNWLNGEYKEFKKEAKAKGTTLLWIGTRTTQSGLTQLHAHTLRGRCLWMPFSKSPVRSDYVNFFSSLLEAFPKGIAIVLPNKNVGNEASLFAAASEAPVLCKVAHPIRPDSTATTKQSMEQTKTNSRTSNSLTHLQKLESESIQILREVIAEAENPVMLYSAGKDSAVMMHLARKACFPANPPLPLLHIDTTWEFQEAITYRDNCVKEFSFELITHTNEEGVEKGVNPFTHGSILHLDIMKTEALKQALDQHGFDVAVVGTRRDEEIPQAKERVFSWRNTEHGWEPRHQRPELWQLYNTHKNPDETMRVYPLSNWSELDIWHYIQSQNIAIAPLYFAADRPVVERGGHLIMVDDDRMPLNEGEVPMMRSVRFRTLDCYPLTSAYESSATTVPQIIQDILFTKTSEQQGRMNDQDSAALTEKRKQEGYF